MCAEKYFKYHPSARFGIKSITYWKKDPVTGFDIIHSIMTQMIMAVTNNIKYEDCTGTQIQRRYIQCPVKLYCSLPRKYFDSGQKTQKMC